MNDYKEIMKLHSYLILGNIPHEMRPLNDGWQICYPSIDEVRGDAVQHNFSYGHEKDLIEIMGLLTPEELQRDTVVGYLTAKEVFQRWFLDYYSDGQYIEKLYADAGLEYRVDYIEQNEEAAGIKALDLSGLIQNFADILVDELIDILNSLDKDEDGSLILPDSDDEDYAEDEEYQE